MIGFGDKLVLSSYSPYVDIWDNQPGQVKGSWGYQNNGYLAAHDAMDYLLGLPYGTGTVVGCCLDRKSKTALFTVDGSKSGIFPQVNYWYIY